MRYLSPATLLGSPVIDKKSLALQKKKLLAELELSDDGQLTIGGRPFSKNDILEYFEALENETTISYHQAISQDKTLIVFLETERIPGNASFQKTSLYSDAAFIQWVSPYFQTAFINDVRYCLQHAAEGELKNLLRNPQLFTDYHRERAWIEIARVLEGNVALLEKCVEQARHKKASALINTVSPLVSGPLIRTILQLPKEPFARVRDNYAFNTMQLSISLFNKNRWKRELAKTWIYKANTLAVSESMHNQVTAKEHEMANMKKRTERNFGIRVAIVLGIIVLRMLFGEKGCNASRGNQHFYTKLTNIPCATCPPPGSSTVSSLKISNLRP